ncbi:MAG: hypothetical protein ACTSYA_01730 [Candidatus Kariarchaeaceae archaeon]
MSEDTKHDDWREENMILSSADYLTYYGLLAHEQESKEKNNRYRGDLFEAIALQYFYEICYDVSRIEETFENGHDLVANAKKYEVKGIRDILHTAKSRRLQRFVLAGEQLSHTVDYFMFIIESASTGVFAIRVLTYKQVLDLINFRADDVKTKYLVTVYDLLHIRPRALCYINGGPVFIYLLPPEDL